MSKKIALQMERKIPFLKVISSCLLVLLMVNNARAQDRKVQNIPKYDKQRVHFGFALGFTSPNFKLTPDPNFRTMDSVYDVESEAQLGFLLGIVYNLRLGDY